MFLLKFNQIAYIFIIVIKFCEYFFNLLKNCESNGIFSKNTNLHMNIYPISDNNTQRLSVDRFKYTLSQENFINILEFDFKPYEM